MPVDEARTTVPSAATSAQNGLLGFPASAAGGRTKRLVATATTSAARTDMPAPPCFGSARYATAASRRIGSRLPISRWLRQHQLRDPPQLRLVVAHHQQRGDGRVAPRAEPLLDARGRADQRDLVGEAVGDGADRLLALPLEEQLLDLVGLGLVAHARHQLLVEVALLRAHAADVEAEARLHRQQALRDVVAHRDLHAGADLEAGLRLPQRVRIDLGPERRVVERQPAVAELGRERDVLRALRAEEDRHVAAQRMRDRPQRLAHPPRARPGVGQGIVRAGVADGPFAAQHLPHDREVLARARDRLVEGLAVPAFDHLAAGRGTTATYAALRAGVWSASGANG